MTNRPFLLERAVRSLVAAVLLLLACPACLQRAPGGGAWELVEPEAGVPSLRDVTWGGGRFVAVGPAGALLTSPDGSEWADGESGVDSHLLSVTYGATTSP